MSGMVCNKLSLIVLNYTILLNSITCFRMELRKASEEHLPDNTTNNMGTLSKKIATNAPDLTEWVSMSFALNPSFNSLIAITSDLNYIRRVSCLMYLTVPYFITEHVGMSRFSPGRIRVF